MDPPPVRGAARDVPVVSVRAKYSKGFDVFRLTLRRLGRLAPSARYLGRRAMGHPPEIYGSRYSRTAIAGKNSGPTRSPDPPSAGGSVGSSGRGPWRS